MLWHYGFPLANWLPSVAEESSLFQGRVESAVVSAQCGAEHCLSLHLICNGVIADSTRLSPLSSQAFEMVFVERHNCLTG